MYVYGYVCLYFKVIYNNYSEFLFVKLYPLLNFVFNVQVLFTTQLSILAIIVNWLNRKMYAI